MYSIHRFFLLHLLQNLLFQRIGVFEKIVTECTIYFYFVQEKYHAFSDIFLSNFSEFKL